jgi:hypothetical protein
MRIFFCLAVMLPLAHAGAAAQVCPAPTLSLQLRDEHGAVVQARAEGVAYTPADGDEAPIQFSAARMDGDSVDVLRWLGTHCIMRLDEVVVRRGGREMRLLPCLGYHSSVVRRRRGTERLWIDTPPFAAGTWVLVDAHLPDGRRESLMRMSARRWMRRDATRTCKPLEIQGIPVPKIPGIPPILPS